MYFFFIYVLLACQSGSALPDGKHEQNPKVVVIYYSLQSMQQYSTVTYIMVAYCDASSSVGVGHALTNGIRHLLRKASTALVESTR